MCPVFFKRPAFICVMYALTFALCACEGEPPGSRETNVAAEESGVTPLLGGDEITGGAEGREKGFGEPCYLNAECASRLCLPEQGTCSAVCDAQENLCPSAQYECALLPSLGPACVPISLVCTTTCPSIDWVRVPGGAFMMGYSYPPEAVAAPRDTAPTRMVRLADFELSRTEVTVRQYRPCVEAGVCAAPASCSYGVPNWTDSRGDREDHPINCLNWAQARTFARWVGADLPTEAEWEYAAREGGGDVMFYDGRESDEIAWYEVNSGGGTHPVGGKRANALGLHDMLGNVWEWNLDEYRASYEGAPGDGQVAVGTLPPCGVTCEQSDARRVSRGGGWNSIETLHVIYRLQGPATDRLSTLGLRLRRLP